MLSFTDYRLIELIPFEFYLSAFYNMYNFSGSVDINYVCLLYLSPIRVNQISFHSSETTFDNSSGSAVKIRCIALDVADYFLQFAFLGYYPRLFEASEYHLR